MSSFSEAVERLAVPGPLLTKCEACDATTSETVLKTLIKRCRKRLNDIKKRRPDDPEMRAVAKQRSRLKELGRACLLTECEACDATTDVTVMKTLIKRCRKRLYDIKKKRPDDPEMRTVAKQRSRLKDLVRNKTTAVIVEDLASAEVLKKMVRRCTKRLCHVKRRRPHDPELSTVAEQRTRLQNLVMSKRTAVVVDDQDVDDPDVPDVAESFGPVEDVPVTAAVERALEVVSTSPPPLLRITSPLPKVKPKSKLKGRLRQKIPPPAVEIPGVEEAAGVEAATVELPTGVWLHAS